MICDDFYRVIPQWFKPSVGILRTMKKRLGTIFANLVFNGYFWSLLAYLPLYLTEQGFTEERIGTCIAVYSFASMALLIPSGLLSDRYNARYLFIFSCLLSAIFVLATFSFKTVFIPLFALGGAGYAISLVSLNSIFYRGIVVSRHTFLISTYVATGVLGYAVGPLLGGQAIHLFGFNGWTWLLFFIQLFLILLAFTFPRENGAALYYKGYLKDILTGRFVLLMAVIFLFASHTAAEITCFSLFMERIVGLSEGPMSWIYFMMGVWVFFLVFFAGRLYKKINSILLLCLLGFGFSGIFQIATAYSITLPLLITTRLAHTIGDTFIIFLSNFMVPFVFAQSRVGAGFAVTQTVRMASVAIFAPVFGMVAMKFSLPAVFHLSGAILIASFLVFAFISKTIRNITAPSAPHG